MLGRFSAALISHVPTEAQQTDRQMLRAVGTLGLTEIDADEDSPIGDCPVKRARKGR